MAELPKNRQILPAIIKRTKVSQLNRIGVRTRFCQMSRNIYEFLLSLIALELWNYITFVLTWLLEPVNVTLTAEI